MHDQRWFRELGLLYVPVSAAGFLVTLLAAIFCVWIFIAVDSRSHSVSDTLIGVYPYILPTLLALYVIAMRTSRAPAASGTP